jgi:hypothetical protein
LSVVFCVVVSVLTTYRPRIFQAPRCTSMELMVEIFFGTSD